jgi:hypothetical protein
MFRDLLVLIGGLGVLQWAVRRGRVESEEMMIQERERGFGWNRPRYGVEIVLF